MVAGRKIDSQKFSLKENDFQNYLVICPRKVLRRQICYMHAIIVTWVHYLTTKCIQRFDHTMVNISSYMKEHMEWEELKDHILRKQRRWGLSYFLGVNLALSRTGTASGAQQDPLLY
jgi:hypothetical protein